MSANPLADAPPRDARHRPTILVAEDDSFLRNFYARLLSHFGFTVKVVEDGLAAWETIARGDQRFDLLITDNEMPRLNGRDLVYCLKAACVPLPVIMVSGSIAYGEDLSEHGIHTALPKPCSIEDLRQAIFGALPLR